MRRRRLVLILTRVAFVVGAAAWQPAGAAATVLVIKSDTLPQYEAPAAAFSDAAPCETVVIDINGSREQAERNLREAGVARTVSAQRRGWRGYPPFRLRLLREPARPR